jgi:hypothetical protein
MATVINIADFRTKKIADAKAEFDACMTRAAEMKRNGKHAFAQQLLEKAHGFLKVIEKLRGPDNTKKVTKLPTNFKNMSVGANVTINGQAGLNLGYPIFFRIPPQTDLTPPTK